MALERVVSLEIEKAYVELKNLLLREKCKIVAEEPSKSIKVEQGSLWFAYTPKKVKKIIDFHFIPYESGKTRIVGITSLATDYTIASIIGYIIAGIVALFLWFSALDLETRIMARRETFWGWLIEIFGYTGFREALALANQLKIITGIIAIVLIGGIILDIYNYSKRDLFAEDTLKLLPQ